MLPIIFSGFMLGLLSAVHCLGMCGPIALVIPYHHNSIGGKIFDGLQYNFGRIFTYTVLGAILGIIGESFCMAAFQQRISLIMGILMLIVAFLLPKKISGKIIEFGIFKNIGKFFKKYFNNLLVKKGIGTLFVLGLLNGLLPCGLVYVALTTSFTFTDIEFGMLFMFSFGIGTLPVMFATFMMKTILKPTLRLKLSKFIPVGIALVAVLLILRGSSLGIKYISPKLPETVIQEVPPCCK